MTKTRQLPLRVDDERRARWQAAAADTGYDLSTFIRNAVDAVVARLAEGEKLSFVEQYAHLVDPPPKPAAPPDNPSNITGGKRTYQPDFKKGKEK